MLKQVTPCIWRQWIKSRFGKPLRRQRNSATIWPIDNMRFCSVWRVLLSTLAAAFGVQSQRNLETDQQSHSILPYIIAGLIFTALFIGILVTLVNIILN